MKYGHLNEIKKRGNDGSAQWIFGYELFFKSIQKA
jgi:hypothetical protein